MLREYAKAKPNLEQMKNEDQYPPNSFDDASAQVKSGYASTEPAERGPEVFKSQELNGDHNQLLIDMAQ